MFEIPSFKTSQLSQLSQLCVKEHSVQSGSGSSYHVGLWDHIEILNDPKTFEDRVISDNNLEKAIYHAHHTKRC